MILYWLNILRIGIVAVSRIMMSLVSVELLVARCSNYFRLGNVVFEVELLVQNFWLFLHIRRLCNACERFLVVRLSNASERLLIVRLSNASERLLVVRLSNASERLLVVRLSSNVTIIVMRCGYIELVRRVI